jgi:hypothetical protein
MPVSRPTRHPRQSQVSTTSLLPSVIPAKAGIFSINLHGNEPSAQTRHAGECRHPRFTSLIMDALYVGT